MRKKPDPTKPDVALGIAYWQSIPATVDGVLGGYGLGTLPRVDALGSRSFLLSVLPRLSAIPPVTEDPVAWQREQMEKRGGVGQVRTRALDCGAGVGRVTESVLLRVVDEVHVAEPVEHFLAEAARLSPRWHSLTLPPSKQPFNARKAAHFHLSTLQALDPARPWSTADGGIYVGEDGAASGSKTTKRIKTDDAADAAVAGGISSSKAGERKTFPPTYSPLDADATTTTTSPSPPSLPTEPLTYDVIWCQWMLQHLSDEDLRSFLSRAKDSLVPQDGVIVVKENVCPENEDGSERVWWDEEDKSITRSTKAYERVFKEAGLNVVRSEVQLGLPAELFVVRMWALR